MVGKRWKEFLSQYPAETNLAIFRAMLFLTALKIISEIATGQPLFESLDDIWSFPFRSPTLPAWSQQQWFFKEARCLMSYDAKTDKIDWKDEYVWMVISLVSGVVLTFIFIYVNRFPNASHVAVVSICCIGFYVLSILIRIQNHRGEVLTAKTAVAEKYLKFIVPIIGFGLGLALIFFSRKPSLSSPHTIG